ncbi:MAG: SH3 domain-containing protein [Hyphomicrobiaceae bacterium]
MAIRRNRVGGVGGAFAALIFAMGLLRTASAQVPSAEASPAGQAIGASGLPVPRFVSLKSDRVHSRQGPGMEYKVLWVYRRPGLPLEVIREFEGWRQVRDSEGAEGWVAQSLVSGRRTALVTPWDIKGGKATAIQLLSDDRDGASPVAVLEAGVITNIRSCNAQWCYVSVGDYRGYIQQSKLWGVYPGEVIR